MGLHVFWRLEILVALQVHNMFKNRTAIPALLKAVWRAG